MVSLKRLTNTLLLTIATIAMSACVPKATEKKAICGANEAFSSVTRSCYSIEEVRTKPVGSLNTEIALEETPKTVTLTYTDSNKDKAVSCKISSITASIEVISPVVYNGNLHTKADAFYQPVSDAAGEMGVSDTAMRDALLEAKKSYSYSAVISKMGVFRTQANVILAMAVNDPNPVARGYYTLAQQKLADFDLVLAQLSNRCECAAGVCTTKVVPKINKSGSASFSYTITDVDGESVAKAVAVTITPMERTAIHLKPVAESSYFSLIESATSIASDYPLAILPASDPIGTAASSFRYTFVGNTTGVTSKGVVSGCMNLPGNDGTGSDTSCIYTPASGDTFNTIIPVKAEVTFNNLKFEAKNYGTSGNNYSVQIYDLTIDNSITDIYVNDIESFGMVSSVYGESFVRVNGNKILIFVNPSVTTTINVQDLVNAHPQANRMVVATAITPAPIGATTAHTLENGLDAFDTFTYKVSNGTGVSEDATVMIKMTGVNDAPKVPRIDNPAFVQSEPFLEAIVGRVITLGFTDVDSFAGSFTIATKIDTDTPYCSTLMTNAAFTTTLVTSTFFTIPATTVGTATCDSVGVCSKDISLTASADYAGPACLYYTVTDASSAVSAVQWIQLNVTNVNDEPVLSSDPAAQDWPTLAPADSAHIAEDLVTADQSFMDIYANPGGDVYEEKQELTVTATSLNTAIFPNLAPCRNYIPVTSTPVGFIVPSPGAVNVYFDTTNGRCYESTGTATANDWKIRPSLTVLPDCAYHTYGQGAPVSTVTTSGRRYLDTTNNKCYVSDITRTPRWNQDTSVTHYKVAFNPIKDQSGTVDIKVTVGDNGGTLNGGDNSIDRTFRVVVDEINDDPIFTIASIDKIIHINEGAAIQSGAIYVNEDEGSTLDEDAQLITLTKIESDNPTLIPANSISAFYDINNNNVEDVGEARVFQIPTPLTAGPTELEDGLAATYDSNLRPFYLKLDPVDGQSGTANLTITVTDNGSPPKLATLQVAVVVHPISAIHGGWNNISSIGLKTDKKNTPTSIADVKCVSDTNKCNTGLPCTGTVNPNGAVLPDTLNAIYYDSSAKVCYISSQGTTAYSWVEFRPSCPITRQDGIFANVVPSAAPTAKGLYYYDLVKNQCYISKGTATVADWKIYTPSKVTLSWKPFTMTGSAISGYNVYRREAQTDFNYKTGFLKPTPSSTMTITGSATTTYTDTTAEAGIVYYYSVVPIDSTTRKFPTYTPESFSQVRVIAAPANYVFVHRWMINQEICTGMNITTTTSPSRIDPEHHFRCDYKGPGESTVTAGYYDYGKDILVDMQELGCPYTAAPKCTSNGCVGMGDPSVVSMPGTSPVNNDIYYDRSTGVCSQYSGGVWSEIESSSGAQLAVISSAVRSALNPPLVNVTQPQAIAICGARSAPADIAGVTFSAPTLPNKKDFMAFSAHKLEFTDPIADMEQGYSLDLNSRCNGNGASGLETSYTNTSVPSTGLMYAIPGTLTSNIRSMFTGSVPLGTSKSTEACVSRYGVQDVYGNVAEWTQDQMTCFDNTTPFFTCDAHTGGSSSFGANDFGAATPYSFNYTIGPFNDANASGAPDSGDGYMTSWAYSAKTTYNAGKFSFPLAMPISSNIAAPTNILPYILEIGAASGIPIPRLFEDGMIVNSEHIIIAARAAAGDNNLHQGDGSFAVGGSYLSGARSGRFSAELIPVTEARSDVGLRCIVPVNAYATGDTKFTYAD